VAAVRRGVDLGREFGEVDGEGEFALVEVDELDEGFERPVDDLAGGDAVFLGEFGNSFLLFLGGADGDGPLDFAHRGSGYTIFAFFAISF
jgi:hypothetical protein